MLEGFSFYKKPTPTTLFSSLQRLSLGFLNSAKDYQSLLGADLPSLGELSLVVGDAVKANECRLIIDGVRRVAPRLRTFSYSLVDAPVAQLRLPSDVWLTFNRLEKLSVDHDTLIGPEMLAPRTLRTLRLRSTLLINDDAVERPLTSFDPLQRALADRLASGLKGLDKMILPAEGVLDEDEASRRQEVLQLCRDRGTTIVETPGYSTKDYYSFMEDALDDFW